jgi:hypothetical protein
MRKTLFVIKNKTGQGKGQRTALTAGGSFDHFRRQGLTAIAP